MDTAFEATRTIRQLAFALAHGAPFNQSVELARRLVAASDAIENKRCVGEPTRNWLTIPKNLPAL